MKIEGAAAIITGGASGLGAGVAAHLSRRGAKVTLFDRDAEAGAARARMIGGHFVAVDVTDEDAVLAAIDEAEARHGVARILVNCAGIARAGKLFGRDGKPAPLADFASVVTVNLIGTFNILSKFAARLHAAEPIGEERGVIVNTSSIAAFDGQMAQAAYAASKGGVAAMTLPIARELARYGIRVMTIAPGIFETPMVASLPDETRASLAAQVPFPARLGTPDEFALLVESIVTNPMLNGDTIRLDGAIRMGAK